MRNSPPDPGYDLPNDEDKEDDPVRFELEFYPNQYTHAGITARLLRNGNPVGMVRFDNEAEFHWMKVKVNGVFDPSQYTEGISDPI